MTTKDNIFQRLHAAVKVSMPVKQPAPCSSRVDVDLVKELIQQLHSNAAQVDVIGQGELENWLAGFFTTHPELPREILTNCDITLNCDGIRVIKGRASGSEKVGLSIAELAIAETGTLVLQSSPLNPTSINYLVDHHIVLLETTKTDTLKIVSNLNQAMAALEKHGIFNSRAINFISGPSRTADIEQTIQLGAHGPRNLLVLVIK